MKLTSFFLLVLLPVSAFSARVTFLTCNLHRGMSRCVDPPIKYGSSGQDWCPYHVCAPSFVSAEACITPIEKAATHVCKVTHTSQVAYTCLENRSHKDIGTPIGCDDNDGTKPKCTGSTRICACTKGNRLRNIFKKLQKLEDSYCE